MDAYNSLVTRILGNATLVKEIDTLASRGNTLNLVSIDWMQRLKNNPSFQQLMEDAKPFYGSEKVSFNQHFRVQTLNNHNLDFIFVAHCKVYEPYNKTSRPTFAITLHTNPILGVLMKAMNSDQDAQEVEFSDTSKLNFEMCSSCCRYCLKARNVMPCTKEVQPCIRKICIYDGESVKNRFASQVQHMFADTFVAILKVELNTRYFYRAVGEQKLTVRIGGNVSKMIAFPESNIAQDLDLGDVYLGLDAHLEASNEICLDALPDDAIADEASLDVFSDGVKRSLDEDIVDVYSSKMKKYEHPVEEIAVEETLITF